MNLREEIGKENSKENTVRIAQYIGNDPQRIAEMMDVFLEGSFVESQRAAWVFSYVAEQNPGQMIPYLPLMLRNLENPVHDAVIRSTIRFMQDIKIPEDIIGEVADRCYAYLQSPQVPVAIRVFSMTVLYNISNTWPELKQELILMIEAHMDYGSAGFKSRGKKLLHKLRKEISA
ncbi:MAG: hypothetical protein R3C61_27725 [Bacteroidia bacterium]